MGVVEVSFFSLSVLSLTSLHFCEEAVGLDNVYERIPRNGSS